MRVNQQPVPKSATIDDPQLRQRVFDNRQLSLDLASRLSDEDQVVQVMDDASPTKWHLAHTTWFYESFILRQHLADYQPFSDDFEYCFNSYYETKGDRHPRAARGFLTRPSAEDVRAYRDHVDTALAKLLDQTFQSDDTAASVTSLLEIGLNHEQQHQELLLTDILALFANQPLRPAYKPNDEKLAASAYVTANEAAWVTYPGGVCEIGHAGADFSYDNEGPRHHVLIHPYKLANRLVTNQEWLQFIEDGGYRNPLLWLADGWAMVQRQGWQAPEYWHQVDGAWHQMTLRGDLPLRLSAPVCHVSYYEADAFARWAGKRLPREHEWEQASHDTELEGNTLGTGQLLPIAARPCQDRGGAKPALQQMFGDVWEWTQSAYQAYPGYRPPGGAIGEYNGKFMCSQQVLRGSSCATVDGHTRRTYRNFFYPHQRWQFMGLRLADDVS
jgi:ergothioneine biosynthesis protein EgtB